MSDLNILKIRLYKELLHDLKHLYDLNGIREMQEVAKQVVETDKYDGYEFSWSESINGVSTSRILSEVELNSLEAEVDTWRQDPQEAQRIVGYGNWAKDALNKKD